MNYSGVVQGLIAFLLIGIFHPIVIKSEYYLGRRSISIFILVGLATLAISLKTENMIISNSFGVFAFCCFWSIKEVLEQEVRVLEGRFPKNPNRVYRQNQD